MVVALSVLAGSFSGLLFKKSPAPRSNAVIHFISDVLGSRVWSIASAAAAFSLLVCVMQTSDAHAAIKSTIQNEAANSFVFDRPNQNDVPLALKLSPFTPAPNEYKRFEEMSKDDRRLALGQVAVGLLAQTLDNRVGHAMLAVTDPLRDAIGGVVSCKQRFSMSSYKMKCRIKF